MNSWNQATAPAYNLKIHNVIDNSLQNKVFELMESEDFYDNINELIRGFDIENDYNWQAGFNGRSGGYLVLYRGGKKLSEHKSYCKSCGQKNFTTIEENNNICGCCGKATRVNYSVPRYESFSYPGKNTEDDEVPGNVLRAFRKLAVNIVKEVEYMAKRASVTEETYTVTKTRKIINY
jgi:hypothetical protein